MGYWQEKVCFASIALYFLGVCCIYICVWLYKTKTKSYALPECLRDSLNQPLRPEKPIFASYLLCFALLDWYCNSTVSRVALLEWLRSSLKWPIVLVEILCCIFIALVVSHNVIFALCCHTGIEIVQQAVLPCLSGWDPVWNGHWQARAEESSSAVGGTSLVGESFSAAGKLLSIIPGECRDWNRRNNISVDHEYYLSNEGNDILVKRVKRVFEEDWL